MLARRCSITSLVGFVSVNKNNNNNNNDDDDDKKKKKNRTNHKEDIDEKSDVTQ